MSRGGFIGLLESWGKQGASALSAEHGLQQLQSPAS